ncbi:MAG: 23S rRNA (adenine(2503)-C(2))-methyltransferase [Candidatus Nealsonbacteria bacterium RIFCSPHIGHO2_01_FULL_43_31]|uniref:Probable dual-specificity RNA methyltransferase RlmN n=1 Tax=Candidatus Nealsonbacteria bacterium RIFCSPHIGHO2_01_FULL_43_31 TaxID=1801665 RepID=A0A1G2E2B4_9BACT|nr:MAG: 23S rRNA (adenine(2503)-C(2))-methyltransferase [Candidatus Nealsonbacteria bacterium RIFCSPHIGHO2_01_FULL_43_31]
MDLNKIEETLEQEPAFRLKQIKKAVFNDLIENWDEATTLPLALRKTLQADCPISELEPEKTLTSKDGDTLKILFLTKDGSKIESVLMKHIDERNTVCVSSQVGCSVGCEFCATGELGFKRNLSDSEIVDQVLYFARLLKKEGDKVTNVVFMGMGEPFLNYDNVLGAIKTLNNKDGFNLGARHMSVSTVGVVEGIKKFTEADLQVNLAISLHAPDNVLRSKLVPLNKTYPIEKVLSAVDSYIQKTKRRVMFEYLMIDGVNDGEKQALSLAKLLKKPLYFLNLISYNPTGHCEFKPSPGWKIKKFKEILERAGISVTQRYEFGKEIKGACGQLAGK